MSECKQHIFANSETQDDTPLTTNNNTIKIIKPCPSNYHCFRCKSIGEHWVMHCTNQKKQLSKTKQKQLSKTKAESHSDETNPPNDCKTDDYKIHSVSPQRKLDNDKQNDIINKTQSSVVTHKPIAENKTENHSNVNQDKNKIEIESKPIIQCTNQLTEIKQEEQGEQEEQKQQKQSSKTKEENVPIQNQESQTDSCSRNSDNEAESHSDDTNAPNDCKTHFVSGTGSTHKPIAENKTEPIDNKIVDANEPQIPNPENVIDDNNVKQISWDRFASFVPVLLYIIVVINVVTAFSFVLESKMYTLFLVAYIPLIIIFQINWKLVSGQLKNIKAIFLGHNKIVDANNEQQIANSENVIDENNVKQINSVRFASFVPVLLYIIVVINVVTAFAFALEWKMYTLFLVADIPLIIIFQIKNIKAIFLWCCLGFFGHVISICMLVCLFFVFAMD